VENFYCSSDKYLRRRRRGVVVCSADSNNTATPAAADSSRTGSRINKLHVQVYPRVPYHPPPPTTIATIAGHADADSTHAPPRPSARTFAATNPTPTRKSHPVRLSTYYTATSKSSYIHTATGPPHSSSYAYRCNIINIYFITNIIVGYIYNII